MRVLSVIPPMTQLNTPYPSTAYLTGFLRSRGVDAVQEDLALKLVLRLLSPAGLDDIRACAEALPKKRRTPLVQGFIEHFARYRYTVGPTIAFLQCRDPTIAHRIASRTFLPEDRASMRWTPISTPTTPRAVTRSPGPSAPWGWPTARATWPRCTSTSSPTSCATRWIRASSSCATPKRWR